MADTMLPPEDESQLTPEGEKFLEGEVERIKKRWELDDIAYGIAPLKDLESLAALEDPREDKV
ncbi:MAG: hypothetical protein WBZ01_21470 [Terriglobales bacterium]|jgi:hypothetical protein